MSWIMSRGISSWRMGRWSASGECNPLSGLGTPLQARQWIDHQNDPLLMDRLRRSMDVPAGISPHMMSDDEVARTISYELSWNRVHVCMTEVPTIARRTDGHSEVGTPEAAPAPRSSRSAPAPSAPKPAEQPSFGKEADLVALAGVLTSASEEGTPFCEECAKAAAAAGGQ